MPEGNGEDAARPPDAAAPFDGASPRMPSALSTLPSMRKQKLNKDQRGSTENGGKASTSGESTPRGSPRVHKDKEKDQPKGGGTSTSGMSLLSKYGKHFASPYSFKARPRPARKVLPVGQGDAPTPPGKGSSPAKAQGQAAADESQAQGAWGEGASSSPSQGGSWPPSGRRRDPKVPPPRPRNVDWKTFAKDIYAKNPYSLSQRRHDRRKSARGGKRHANDVVAFKPPEGDPPAIPPEDAAEGKTDASDPPSEEHALATSDAASDVAKEPEARPAAPEGIGVQSAEAVDGAEGMLERAEQEALAGPKGGAEVLTLDSMAEPHAAPSQQQVGPDGLPLASDGPGGLGGDKGEGEGEGESLSLSLSFTLVSRV